MSSHQGPHGCGLGCYGLLALFALGLQLTYLLFLNPPWLDRLAFWRGPLLPQESVLTRDIPESCWAEEDQVEEAFQAQRDRKRIQLYEAHRVHAAYTPQQGASLTTLEGARIEIPPGALPAPEDISLTPVLWMPQELLNPNLAVVGPGYQIRVGDRSHVDFDRPLRVTLPVVPDLVNDADASSLAIYVGRDGNWRPCPTHYDPERMELTALVDQASWWFAFKVVVRVAVGGGLATAVSYQLSATVRGIYHQFTGTLDQEYETNSFSIHYTEQGADAVPKDSGVAQRLRFPLSPQSAVSGIPNMVVLTAEILEGCRPGLASVGVPIPDSWTRHDVFLTAIPEGGLSPPGGPVWITTLWTQGAGYTADLDRQLRGTIAHELVHVGQGRFFSNWQARKGKWWFEMTAPYLADRYWEKQGRPCNQLMDIHMIDDDGKMLSHPLDIDNSEINYTYGMFFRWLEPQCNTLALIETVNRGGDSQAAALDAALRAATQKGLGALLSEFAQAYYHDNLWDAQTVPFVVFDHNPTRQVRRQSCEGKDFSLLARVVPGGRRVSSAGAVNMWASAVVGKLPRLTTKAYLIDASAIPGNRKGKLVVELRGFDDQQSALVAAMAESTVGGTLPARGTRGSFQALRLPDEPTYHVVEKIGSPGGCDRFTLLISNTSLKDVRSSGTVTRWALLAPAYAESTRTDPKGITWQVTWHRAEFKDEPMVFAGYHVYRRKLGETEQSWTRVASYVEDEFYEDDAPDREDYVYTASVVDRLDHESEKAAVLADDPFQGVWKGKITLLEGSIEQSIMKWLRNWLGDEEESQGLLETASSWVKAIERLLKAGLPVQFNIRRVEGEYSLQPTHLMFLPVEPEDNPPVPLSRVGMQTLCAPPEDGQEPIFFCLEREDQLVAEWTTVEGEENEETSFSWRGEFQRTDGILPPSN